MFRLLWATLLNGAVVLPFASLPTTSGKALTTLACSEPPPVASGAYLDYRLRQTSPSTRAQDPGYQRAVLAQSRALLKAVP